MKISGVKQDLGRLGAALATKLRNLFPHGATADIWERVEARLSRDGPFRASDRIRIGPAEHPLSVSRMAVGTGTGGWLGSSNQTKKLGVDGLADLLVAAFEEHGINCWDSADQYGSHPHVAKALKRVDRSKVVVLTKTCATTAAGMREELDRFRRELDTDYIDILLLHCMTSGRWPAEMEPVKAVIAEAQAAGIVRVKGVSCHSLAALKAAVNDPWVDLDLARINPDGQQMDAAPNEIVPLLDRMKANGKTVMGMKLFGGGALADERREACLRFALGLDCVDCFTIGFESRAEMEETIALLEAIRGQE